MTDKKIQKTHKPQHVDTDYDADGQIDFNALLRKFDSEARYRRLSGVTGAAVSAIAVAMACFHMYTAGFGLLSVHIQGAVHLAFALSLTLLLYPMRTKSGQKTWLPIRGFLLTAAAAACCLYIVVFYAELAERAANPTVLDFGILFLFILVILETTLSVLKTSIPIRDFFLAAVAAACCLYIVVFYAELANRSGNPTGLDLGVGFLFILVILEATRRISNPVLPCLAIAALAYCYFGRSLPASLQHGGLSISRIINHMYLGTEGVFGTPVEVSSTFVFMFILFGAILEKAGIGRFIIDLALALAGRSTGGPAKVAVLASGLMGTVSGSSVANVCTTGMFTIPLMKSVGYRPHFAGAVEAVASTGGQIMPPVMGAGAFIMAQFLNVNYLVVAMAAIVPALLYYTAVLIQVHLEAQRLGLSGIAPEHLPKAWQLLKRKGFLLIPLAAIVYFLLAGYTPLMAAFYGILCCIGLSWFNKDTRLTPKKLFEAFDAGARSALPVACACACVGMIVGTGTLTGLAFKIAMAIVDLSGNMLLPALLLTMCASLLLGIGLPTTANFIVTSTMAAPALLKLGVPDLAAYMFVFYFGIAADITPPVALAAYAGAGIAGSDPMRTGVTACKLALSGFIVPFIYVYNPMLLFIEAQPLPFIQALCTALLGVFLLATASIGFYKIKMPVLLRVAALVGALGLLDPGTYTDIIGLGIFVFIHVLQTVRLKKEQAESEKESLA